MVDGPRVYYKANVAYLTSISDRMTLFGSIPSFLQAA